MGVGPEAFFFRERERETLIGDGGRGFMSNTVQWLCEATLAVISGWRELVFTETGAVFSSRWAQLR